jgi:hypothetical protein
MVEGGAMDEPTGTAPTRWELLFADLEAQAVAQDVAEADALVAELTRAEHATMTLADRFRAALGAEVVLDLAAGEPVRGTVREAAAEWVLLSGVAPGGPAQHLVPLSAVSGVSGLGRQAAPQRLREGLGLGPLLRGLQRDRARLLVRTFAGAVEGRVGRVGRDHFDVEVVRGDGANPRSPWQGARTVPFAALVCVSEAP